MSCVRAPVIPLTLVHAEHIHYPVMVDPTGPEDREAGPTMYVCVHVCMYVCMYETITLCVCVYAVCMYVCIHYPVMWAPTSPVYRESDPTQCTYVCVFVCMHTDIEGAFIHTLIHEYIHIYIHTYAYTYTAYFVSVRFLCICVYIHTYHTCTFCCCCCCCNFWRCVSSAWAGSGL